VLLPFCHVANGGVATAMGRGITQLAQRKVATNCGKLGTPLAVGGAASPKKMWRWEKSGTRKKRASLARF